MGTVSTTLKCGVLILICIYFVGVELKFENCIIQSQRPAFNPELEVLRYGKPTAYVTTKSIGFSPYVVTDPFRQSSLYHEYLLIGPGIANVDPRLKDSNTPAGYSVLGGSHEEEIHLLLYDLEAIRMSSKFANLIHQNLAKEYMFALINATGMLPSMTVMNTTFEKTFRFHTQEGNNVAYQLDYPHLFRTPQTTPPLDVIIEFPAKTRMFQTLKTMIDYQTFGLLRWRLTPSIPVEWRVLETEYGEWQYTINGKQLCRLPPENETIVREPEFMRCVYNKRWGKLDNPCIKDMIILYTLRGQTPDNTSTDDVHLSVTRLFITVPMVYEFWGFKGWIDLTEAYCPRPELDEECGEPQAVQLTNDHILILTDRGLWVSNSLNTSRDNVSLPYSMKPLAKWTPIDPCSQFNFFNCSEINSPVLALQTFRQQRLFYTPICHLYQYPVYEDMVMLVYDHVSQAPDKSSERDVFTVMYAPKPYNDWKILFYARHEYVTKDGPLPIKELIGVWFNHYRRQFDLSVVLTEEHGTERTFRFVLPLPTDPDFKGYQELNGLLGNGFLEFEFPPGFTMTDFAVNPEALDIFFLGNQIWVAEAAGAFLYLSLPGVENAFGNKSIVSGCSFNHPDRTFLCLEKSHSVMYPGRVGIQYSPVSVLFERIYELRFTMYHNLWPYTYRQYIALLGNFVVGYSGKIMLWFLYDPNDVAYAQQVVVDEMDKTNTKCDDEGYVGSHPVNCYVCKGLLSTVKDNDCTIEFVSPEDLVVEFKMLAFDPTVLQSRDWISAGPLVPFLVDGDKVVLFEAEVPELSFYKPDYDYFEDVDVGNRIFCRYPPGESENEMSGSGGTLQPPPPDNSTNMTGPGPDGRRRRDAAFDNEQWEQQERLPRQSGIDSSTAPHNVTCPSLTQDKPKFKCELYIRHMKNLRRHGEQLFLKGFRRTLFATVISSFAMRPIPTDMVVVILPNSNDAIIQLGDTMFNVDTFNKYYFSYRDVGQTLYIPDHFSVLLLGFPKFRPCSEDPPPPGEILLHDMLRMVGMGTRYYRQGIKIKLKPFEAFLIDFSTPDFCKYYKNSLMELNSEQCDRNPAPKDVTTQRYVDRRDATNAARIRDHDDKKKFNIALNEYYTSSFYDPITAYSPPFFKDLRDLDPMDYYTMEELLLYESLETPAVGKFENTGLMINVLYNVSEDFSPEYWKHHGVCNTSSWEVVDGGCHLRLYLSKNSVLKQNGGRISLDKFDSLSFQLKLRPLTTLGKSLIHRSLIAVTNTNPDILSIEQTEAQGKDIQIMNVTLTPTGYGIGVATVSIRPLIVSPMCLFADGSFSLIVQVQRAPGRRLHVNYPVPRCKPLVDDEEYLRPWKIDMPDCVYRTELLTKKEVRRPDDIDIGQVFYSELPINYRPPSPRGSEIPISKNVYHVDPSKPDYKRIYRISKETGELSQCKDKKDRKECNCQVNDMLSEDSYYTDCKRMVYTAKRGFRVDINLEYDRVMRDEDQHQTFFAPKKNWTVYVEEVNARVEFSLSGTTSPYLELIHNQTHLNQGRKHYDAKTLGVTLHGTGLFHFKAVLASFESFGEVSCFFMIYIPNNELNHVQLVVIMLLIITVCMMFVFLGFLIVRRRLSSQLPFQPRTNAKNTLE